MVVNARELEGLEPYVVTGRTFIPDKRLKNPLSGISKNKSFAGDNRNTFDVNSTAFRTEQKVRLDIDNQESSTLSNIASSTIAFGSDGSVTDRSDPGKAGPDPEFIMNGNSATVNLEVDASNKLVFGAPSIDYKVSITITQNEDGTFSYSIGGQRDGFPAYEFFITNESTGESVLIYGSNPNDTGNTPRALFPPMEEDISSSGTVGKKDDEEKKGN